MINDIRQELPELNYWDFILQLCRRRKKLKVIGNSMEPTLKPGEKVLLNPYAYKKRAPQVNDIVVICHPKQPNLEIIKRITKIEQTPTGDRYFLLGDNLNHSSDSRNFGLISQEQILGKVTTSAHFTN